MTGPTAITLGALIDRFLAHVRAAVAGGRTAKLTADFYAYQLGHLRRATGADGRPLVEREAASVGMIDLAGVPATHHCTRAVKRLYRWAKLPDPLAEVTIPPAGQRNRVLTRAEFRALRRAAGHETRRMIWFLSQTGARPIELRQLLWEDVDEGERVLRLKRFKARDRRRDGKRVRLIPMTAAAAEVLRRWRRERCPRPDELVFLNERGRGWTGEGLRLAMHRAAEKAGLNRGGERVVAYTLRHTFATMAAANGIQETLLADILGHTTLSTTRRYLHRKAADLVRGLDAAMGRGRGGPGRPPGMAT